MNEFIYNEHGGCENPIVKKFRCGKGYEAQVLILIAQNNLWAYGVRFNGFEEGWSYTFNHYRPDNEFYKTESEALIAGVKSLINQLQNRNNSVRYKRVIELLEGELKPVAEQLSLF